jgi:Na+/H+ antiporter NhaB
MITKQRPTFQEALAKTLQEFGDAENLKEKIMKVVEDFEKNKHKPTTIQEKHYQ